MRPLLDLLVKYWVIFAFAAAGVSAAFAAASDLEGRVKMIEVEHQEYSIRNLEDKVDTLTSRVGDNTRRLGVVQCMIVQGYNDADPSECLLSN